MYLISTQEFVNQTFISNVNEVGSGINEKVNDYIDSCVPKLLKLSLGLELFSELNSQITDGVLNTDADQKWKDLVNGKIYTKDDKTYEWEGLVIDRGLFKESLLAFYVWSEFMNDNLYAKGSQGDVVIQTKNSIVASPVAGIVKNWNRFLEMYQGGLCDFFTPKTSYVNGAYFVDYYKNERNNTHIVDLLTFLKDNETDYPSANLFVFTDTSKSNRYSI